MESPSTPENSPNNQYLSTLFKIAEILNTKVEAHKTVYANQEVMSGALRAIADLAFEDAVSKDDYLATGAILDQNADELARLSGLGDVESYFASFNVPIVDKITGKHYSCELFYHLRNRDLLPGTDRSGYELNASIRIITSSDSAMNVGEFPMFEQEISYDSSSGEIATNATASYYNPEAPSGEKWSTYNIDPLDPKDLSNTVKTVEVALDQFDHPATFDQLNMANPVAIDTQSALNILI